MPQHGHYGLTLRKAPPPSSFKFEFVVGVEAVSVGLVALLCSVGRGRSVGRSVCCRQKSESPSLPPSLLVWELQSPPQGALSKKTGGVTHFCDGKQQLG